MTALHQNSSNNEQAITSTTRRSQNQDLLLKAIDAAGEILRHSTSVDRVDTSLFHDVTVTSQVGIPVQTGPMLQAFRPCKDAGYGVGARRLTFLILTVMSCHRTVCSLGLDGLTIRTHQNTGHEAK